jgi:hypothetical protein
MPIIGVGVMAISNIIFNDIFKDPVMVLVAIITYGTPTAINILVLANLFSDFSK